MAAQLAYQFNILRLKVADASLPQDNLRGKTPLCASAYKYVFNTCRIPAPEQDVIGVWNAEQNNHIMVFAKNSTYQMNLSDDITPTEIMANLAWIK